nr:Scr1 family TA system antitoxin-like transcriptional regulator [Saccharopolyspora phatthalungensis]
MPTAGNWLPTPDFRAARQYLDSFLLEFPTGSLYLAEPEENARYTLNFDHLRATALDPRDSVKLLGNACRAIVQKQPIDALLGPAAQPFDRDQLAPFECGSGDIEQVGPFEVRRGIGHGCTVPIKPLPGLRSATSIRAAFSCVLATTRSHRRCVRVPPTHLCPPTRRSRQVGTEDDHGAGSHRRIQDVPLLVSLGVV